MSPVFGVVNRDGGEATSVARSMMNSLSHSSRDKSWIVSNRSVKAWNNSIESIYGQALGKISSATKKPPEEPAFDYSRSLAVLYEGNLYNIRELRANLLTTHNIHLESASEVVAHLLADVYQGDLKLAIKQVVPILDGDYFLVVSDGTQTVTVRDTAGLRPAFYAQRGELMVFATLKKALWEIGLHDVKPLRAGMLASFGKDGVDFEDTFSLPKMGIEVEINDMATAVDGYCDLISSAVRKRVRDLKKLGVLLSGGVDSCLMAKLVAEAADESGTQVIAYTAGLNGTDDIDYAEHFAQELGLKHKVRRISLDEIEAYIPKVVRAVEERDMVQIEAGIGIYAALEVASQDDIRTIFSGQGPDELWGGYSWYPGVIAAEGYEGLQKRMWDDLERSDIETFDRENKIALALGSEQLFPYCDTEVVRLAMSVSPRLKIKSAEDGMGKHPHREAAVRFGVPEEFAYRAKNAAQHGTGVHDTLDAIAHRNGFTPELVANVGYNSEEVCREKLASSTRYGYRYTNRKLWQVPEHIQFFLDSVAYEKGLLNKRERLAISRFLQKAGT
jgi:asparagine synthase (glutamine-hydrolysing)